MAWRLEGFGRLAILATVIVCILYPAPLAARAASRALGQGREATSSDASVPATADAVIEEMARAAGVIFAGQVTAIRQPPGLAGLGQDAGEGAVEVDFRVDRAVRGPESGSIYTLREWAGLWDATGGGARYQVGQRLLVFFYKPDMHGLSSPVNGRDGAVRLCGGGTAPGPDDATASAADWMVDLRWVQARALMRRTLETQPVWKPVSPRPIRGPMPEEKTGRREVEVETTQVRRLPLPEPLQALTPAPVETEPLEQVLMICQQAMRRADVTQ